MATRVLPGAYVTLNDLSYFPEGQTSLVVGYVLKCNRGDTEKPFLVTSPSDFLAKTTLTGAPSISDDPTYWSILKVLAQTNQVYIARAAKDPKYGGATLKKPTVIGDLVSVVKNSKTITVTGSTSLAQGKKIVIRGTGAVDGIYTVDSSDGSTEGSVVITVTETIAKDYTTPASANPKPKVCEYEVPVVAISTGYASVNEAKDAIASDNTSSMMIIGKNPGAYNSDLLLEIVSATDNPSALPYYIGSEVFGANTSCTFDTMQLTVRIAETKEIVESFLFSLDPEAKAVDGTSLFVDSVVAGSSYIQVVYKETTTGSGIPASFALPISTVEPVQTGGGSNGDTVTEPDLEDALKKFEDKTIPISILGSGCSADAETKEFQQAMLGIADKRKDIVCFLSSPKSAENETTPSEKAQAVVDYKKNDLASTSFYGCMYTPHVNTSDTFNSRQIKIGTDAVAIAGWLNVINNLNYPYAYAGPQNGLVTGVTCDWKIGDESGEAELLNDASINYVAFDGKVGRYYMQCQNTLQVANSSLRNIGCVLNVLDIKENLGVFFKEYTNLPITDTLRRDIMNKITSYLAPMAGTRFYNYSFQDVTTDADIAQDTLRYLLQVQLTRYSSKLYCAINVVSNTYQFSMLQSA